jgi:alkylation response protein AidB-like acyl-CoA dehydrogenase
MGRQLDMTFLLEVEIGVRGLASTSASVGRQTANVKGYDITIDSASYAGETDTMTSSAADGAALGRGEMVSRVRELGPVFAERAVRYDREATCPWETFADLREAGLLALCVPKLYA